MVQTWLTGGSTGQYIAAKVEDMPIGHYAAQLMALLRQRGLADLADCLALPVYGQEQVQWYYQGQVRQNISWREASAKQQVVCLEKLLKMTHSVSLLQEQMRHLSLPSSTLIDQILQNLTVLPSTDVIRIINQQPVILFWGYFSTDRQQLDLAKLHAELAQQLAPSDPPKEEGPVTPVLMPTPLVPQRKQLTVKKITLCLLIGMLIVAATSCYLFFLPAQPVAVTPLTVPEPIKVTPVERELTHLAATVVRLPLMKARYDAPPAPKAVELPKVIWHKLMIPARSRYQGNIDFLNGRWQASDGKNNIEFNFKQGKSLTQFTRANSLCSVISNAAFTASGKLLITSSKAQCQPQLTTTLPTIVCENSSPNTRCHWRDASSPQTAITLLQEQ